MPSKLRAITAAAACSAGMIAAVGLAQPADAAPACAAGPSAAPVKIAQLPGWTESMVVDRQGRMFTTQSLTGEILRIDHPGATPVVLAHALSPGGIVVRPDGKLLVGTENLGVIATNAKLLLIDPDTGATSTYASGLSGVDGVALAPDGTVYTSTFASTIIGRVSPSGVVQRVWSTSVVSPNGLAVSPDGAYVYSDQTAPAPSLYRIAVGDPTRAERIASAGPLDALAAPDGLTLDSAGTPVVATQVGGQIWRQRGTSFCTIQGGLPAMAQITYGHSSHGFSAGRLFRAGDDGSLLEIPAGFDPNGS